jgi:hypothetical protein
MCRRGSLCCCDRQVGAIAAAILRAPFVATLRIPTVMATNTLQDSVNSS